MGSSTDGPGYGTPFTETEALVAALRHEWREARLIIDGMLPGERRTLAQALDLLDSILDEAQPCPGCQRPVRGDDQVGSTRDLVMVSKGRGGLPFGSPLIRWHQECRREHDAQERTRKAFEPWLS